MTSTNTNISRFLSCDVNILRAVACIIAVTIMHWSVSTCVMGQYSPVQYDPNQYIPVQSNSGQLQPLQPLNAAVNPPIQNPAAATSTYGGMPVASGPVVPIQAENTRLAESNTVFDGEVEGLANRMQSTDPTAMQNFRTGSSDMIPSGIEQLRPIEAEQSNGQMQSQMLSTPSTSGSSHGVFGTGTERPLAEMNDEPFDFSAIMQQQKQAGDNALFGDNGTASQQNNPFAVGEDLQEHSGGKLVDITGRQGIDTEVEDLIVDSVIIEGNGKIPQHTIRNTIKTMAGYPFRLQTVQEDARTLNQMGCFFSVTPRYQRKNNNLVVVRFELVERPIFHSVQFVGNHKIWKRTLAEQVGIKKGDPVDVAMVMHGREKLKEYYRSEGFERASITVASGDRIDDRNVVYIINEGVKQRVLDTEIVGSRFLTSSRLKTYVESKPGILYIIGGEFSREKIDADVEKILEFYQRYGFFDIQVDRTFDDTNGYWGLSEPGSWIKVKFIVSEGPRYKINRIKFVGNQRFSDEELSKKFKLKSGDYYQQTLMLLDEASIGQLYGNEGLLLTRAKGHVRLIDDKPGEIDLTYAIRESAPVIASQINIDFVGDVAHTRTSTLLKYLALSNIKPGRLVTANMIRNAEKTAQRGQFLNTNPSEGAVPRIIIEPEDEEYMDLDGEMLDRELQDIEEMIIRGQSSDDYSYMETPAGLSPRDWRHIQQRNGLGTHPAFPDPVDYRVYYPQYDETTAQSGVFSPSAMTSTPAPQNQTFSVQQGNYTVPEQYQGYQSTPYSPSSQFGTVQAGTVPSLPVNTNVSTPGTALGFIGQDDSAPYNPGTANSNTGGLFSPSASYGGNQYGMSQGTAPTVSNDPLYGTGTLGSQPGTVGTLDNQIIPATTNPSSYYGENGYGSVTQASGLLPTAGAYNETGAPGSVTRTNLDPLADYTRAKINFRVQEGKTGNITMGVSLNSDSGLVGRFALEERNFDWRKLPTNPWSLAGWRNAFRGAGQKFLLEAMPGQNYQRYRVSFQEPFLWNTKFSLGLDGFYYTRYYDEWREHRTGGGVTFGRAWTDRFSTSVSFNGANIKIYDPYPIPDLYEVLGNNAQYAFGLSATYDTRDNAMMPTEGGTLTVTAEQVLGTSKFMRGGYDARRYLMIPGTRRGDNSGGWVIGLRSAASITEKSTPIYERYYAGGYSTIRGFEYRGVTPRWYGYGVGGNFEFYNSVELCFPISADDNFRGVFFLDTGTVEKSISKWESEYRVAPGFGFRINIPMMGPVPIAFDFAFPVNKQSGDITTMFSFNMGLVR